MHNLSGVSKQGKKGIRLHPLDTSAHLNGVDIVQGVVPNDMHAQYELLKKTIVKKDAFLIRGDLRCVNKWQRYQLVISAKLGTYIN